MALVIHLHPNKGIKISFEEKSIYLMLHKKEREEVKILFEGDKDIKVNRVDEEDTYNIFNEGHNK